MKQILFTVTNDLTYDQRMSRICQSLTGAGFAVTLIGRSSRKSLPLQNRSYRQLRMNCWFQKGKSFYIEYNFRLFFHLVFAKADLICSIDLDTVLPVWIVSRLRHIPRVYDAHELFCEMKEVITRPAVYRVWKRIEKWTLPSFPNGYTVSPPIVEEFKRMYGLEYGLIRNMALLDESFLPGASPEKYILYQGAVNEGRSFETLIPAMKQVDLPLYIYGDGNFMHQAKELVSLHNLEQKVFFKGPASAPTSYWRKPVTPISESPYLKMWARVIIFHSLTGFLTTSRRAFPSSV